MPAISSATITETVAETARARKGAGARRTTASNRGLSPRTLLAPRHEPVTYMLGVNHAGAGKPVTELVVSNFDLPPE